MSQKISARTAASTLTGAEILGVVQGGADRRVTLALAAGDYVTPEKYGAVGDGTTDDTTAFQAALDTGATGVFAKNIYKITTGLSLLDNQTIFGLPKSMVKEDSPGANNGRIIFNPGSANKVCIKNTASTTGNGVQDLYITMNDNSHTAIQFSTTYGNVVQRVHFDGTMRLGVLVEDAYVVQLDDCVFNGTSVRTACIFIGTSNGTRISRLHTSTAPNDSAECLYGIALSAAGNGNAIHDCIFQGITIGIAASTAEGIISNPYYEEALCAMRLGNIGATQGSWNVIGGTYGEANSGHSQYAKRGPLCILACNTVTFTSPHVTILADNTTARGPWPFLCDSQLRFTLINPFHFNGATATYGRDMVYQKNGGMSGGITMIGAPYSAHQATEIILKDSGAYGMASHGIRVDNGGTITASAYTPAQAFAAIDALLTTDLPTGASLLL